MFPIDMPVHDNLEGRRTASPQPLSLLILNNTAHPTWQVHQTAPSLRDNRSKSRGKQPHVSPLFRLLVRYERVLSLAIHGAYAPLSLTTINTPEKLRPNYSFSPTESP